MLTTLRFTMEQIYRLPTRNFHVTEIMSHEEDEIMSQESIFDLKIKYGFCLSDYEIIYERDPLFEQKYNTDDITGITTTITYDCKLCNDIKQTIMLCTQGGCSERAHKQRRRQHQHRHHSQRRSYY